MRFVGRRAEAHGPTSKGWVLRGVRLSVLSLGLGLVACGGRGGPSAAAPPPPAPPASEAARDSETAEERADREAQELVNAALARIAALRGLTPRGPVDARHLTAAELVQEVEDSLERHVPPRAIQGTSEMLFALGTVPPNFDYRKSLATLMGTDLAGLYDPDRKRMFLRGDMDETALEATLLHELVHALQDQHYGLDRILKWRDDATDELSALSALAEGDATSAMLDAMLAETGRVAHELPTELLETQMRMMTGSAHDGAVVPGILKRSLISPYVDGLRFVHGVRQERGWQGVDEVWQRPPATTEQLLHLDKYRANEGAQAVPVPPAPPTAPAQGAWEVLLHDVWGEQSLRLLFEEWMPTRTAAVSATGWAGDRIVAFSAGEHRALAWHVVADDEEAARRMHVAFLRGVFGKGWSADPSPVADVSEEAAKGHLAAGELCRERPGAGPFLAERRGRRLAVVAGPYLRPTSGEAPRSASGCDQARLWAASVLDD